MFNRIKALLKEVVNRVLNRSAIKSKIDVDIAVTNKMAKAIDLWCEMYENRAPWLNDKVTSLNLPNAIAGEFARLVTLELESEITGNDYLNEQYQTFLKGIRKNVEYACAKGGIVFKPYVNGENIEIDYVQAEDFYPTAFNSRGEVTGAVFLEYKNIGDTRYTRLEYHSFTKQGYFISNSAFKTKDLGYRNESLGKQIELSEVDDWADLEEIAEVKNVDRPLFAYFKMPMANSVDKTSPLGVSVFHKAIDQIKEADQQWSRMLWEYEGSELAINASVDCFKLNENGEAILPEGRERLYRSMEYGVGEFNKAFEVFSPAIRDTSLFNGLNEILRKIEFNCGLAYGTLSNAQETEKTATEIINSKQRSYSTVKDIQNALEDTLNDLIYIMDVYAKMYRLSNSKYEVSFNWDDSLVVDKNTDLLSMQADVAAGLLRPEIYLAKKYGVTEEEALKMMPKQVETQPNPYDEE